ncbi:hypothetical protein Lser_V15G31731 [Lactuca serriola]
MMVDGLEARIAMGMYMGIHNPTTLRSAPSFMRTKLRAKPSATLIASSSRTEGRTVGGLLLQPKHDLNEVKGDDDTVNNIIIKKKKRVFFLDVNPICYDGSTPSLHSFAHWIFLFFSEVSLTDPVIVRCILGDEADGVPRIQHLVPGFGMLTLGYRKSGCIRDTNRTIQKLYQASLIYWRKLVVPKLTGFISSPCETFSV